MKSSEFRPGVVLAQALSTGNEDVTSSWEPQVQPGE